MAGRKRTIGIRTREGTCRVSTLAVWDGSDDPGRRRTAIRFGRLDLNEEDSEPPGFPFSGVEGLGHENDWGSLGILESEYDDSLSADYAVRFLSAKQDRPFFLACGVFRPHLPWYVPQEYFDLYPLDEVVLPRVASSTVG